MDQDTEVLDWGNDDDEQQGLDMYRSQRLSGDGHDSWRDPEEGEDAVSLGGDDDDMQNFYTYQSSEQDTSKGQNPTSKSASQSQLNSQKRDHQRDTPSQKPSSSQTQTSDSASLRRSQSLGKLTHALPPKPVLVPATFVSPLPVQTSTLASTMVPRETKANGHGKSGSLDSDSLPPDWEVRYSRGATRERYFYNVKTHKSTWTQPGPVSASRSSPSKERDTEDARSPHHSGFDDAVEADIPEKRSSSRTDRRARPSSPPNATSSLSYEDRHYRPGETSNSSEPVVVGARREMGDFYRPGVNAEASPPPRAHNERRRSRSLTPRRDDRHPERSARGGRDISPASPVKPSVWRETREEVVQDRREASSWGRSRASSNANAVRGRSPETRVQSRYETMDLETASHYEPKPKEKRTRQHADEWSTSRNRSVSSSPRNTSPYESRRAPRRRSSATPPPSEPLVDSTTSMHRSRRDVSLDPMTVSAAVPPPRMRDERLHGETIPSRRAREPDPADEFEPKRRRMDGRVTDIPIAHRVSGAETVPSTLPEKPVSSPFPFAAPVQGEQSRPWKRQPLPPQRDRFRAASSNVSLPDGAPSPHLPPHQAQSDVSLQRSIRPSGDLPPTPRRQFDGPPRETDYDRSARAVPARSAPQGTRTRSRFDDAPSVAPAPEYSTYADRDMMDVDLASRSQMSTPLINDGSTRYLPTTYPDRGAEEVVPRAPRAMASSKSNTPTLQPSYPASPLSPSATSLNLRSVSQDSAPISGRIRSRPLPHTPVIDNDERRDHRDAYLLESRSPVVHQDAPSRRHDDGRQLPHASPPHRARVRQEHFAEPSPLPHREHGAAPSRQSRRDAPVHPLTGTNSVPIGNRKGYNAEPALETYPSRSPIETRAEQRIPPVGRDDVPRGYHDGDHDRDLSNSQAPPSSRFRPVEHAEFDHPRSYPPIPRSDAPFTRALPPHVPLTDGYDEYRSNVLPPLPQQDPYAGVDRHSHGDRSRPSRFGPEPAQESARVSPSPVLTPREPDSQPRIWMTRDQARESEALKPARGESNHALPAKNQGRPRQREIWPPPDEQENSLKNVAAPYPSPAVSFNRLPALPAVMFPDSHPAARRTHNGSSGRTEEPVDTHSTSSNRSLEGRLSSQFKPSHLDEVQRTANLPPPPPLPPVWTRTRVSRDEDPPVESGRTSRAERVPASWDRPELPPALEERSTSLKVPRERAVPLERPASISTPTEPDPPSPTVYAEPKKMSKPVRIRRPPPSSTSAPVPQESYGPSSSSNAEPVDALQRNLRGSSYRTNEAPTSASLPPPPVVDGLARPPAVRRGGSLLERLTLDDTASSVAPDLPSPSLRDRVEPNHEPIMSSQSDMGMEVDYEENGKGGPGLSPRGNGVGGSGGNGGRGRKRSGKPRRGSGRRGN